MALKLNVATPKHEYKLLIIKVREIINIIVSSFKLAARKDEHFIRLGFCYTSYGSR